MSMPFCKQRGANWSICSTNWLGAWSFRQSSARTNSENAASALAAESNCACHGTQRSSYARSCSSTEAPRNGDSNKFRARSEARNRRPRNLSSGCAAMLKIDFSWIHKYTWQATCGSRHVTAMMGNLSNKRWAKAANCCAPQPRCLRRQASKTALASARRLPAPVWPAIRDAKAARSEREAVSLRAPLDGSNMTPARSSKSCRACVSSLGSCLAASRIAVSKSIEVQSLCWPSITSNGAAPLCVPADRVRMTLPQEVPFGTPRAATSNQATTSRRLQQ
mmetsp:Transcript_36531/g.96277  ORF Transcript_36531/g.96277 Transcript_36531/m.96277 type:complete len:278 (+) Transcript_36531:173-1006(+)